jgi:hypothetical protein
LAQAQEQAKLAHFADHEDLKSLRDEIGLVRMMIQATWNSAKTDVEKLQAYSKVNTFCLTLERLVKTCQTLDQSMGHLIAKPALLRLAQSICNIVVTGLEGVPDYEARCDVMIPQIIQAVEKINNLETTPGSE